ncbi:unnamed protein product [Staurois parvus]|uniref:Uncharacterized protein n=1 Tax=Staurois parvus TaxID=386267 RepID=A0ABN9H7Y2_9NEOB|nr:unnamed protein product [Staurois parvus]
MPASGFRVPVTVTSGRTGAGTGGKFNIFKKCHFLKNYYYICISHTFCPYCFVLCPACILTVLSAWQLRKIHGVQKASLYVKSGFRPAREQR